MSTSYVEWKVVHLLSACKCCKVSVFPFQDPLRMFCCAGGLPWHRKDSLRRMVLKPI